MIDPHGGKLISRIPTGPERVHWLEYALFLRKVEVGRQSVFDLELIATGAYSPLVGFQNEREYLRVLRELRLDSGLGWALPVTLPVTAEDAKAIQPGQDVTLRDSSGRDLAVLRVEDVFEVDATLEAEALYGTRDLFHPGIARLYDRPGYRLGGSIVYLAGISNQTGHHHSPSQARRHFENAAWKTVGALPEHQLANLSALDQVDGLFLNPALENDDNPSEIVERCYEIILQHSYPTDRTFLSVLAIPRIYGGAREEAHFAIVRQNYGATHVLLEDDATLELLRTLNPQIRPIRPAEVNA